MATNKTPNAVEQKTELLKTLISGRNTGTIDAKAYAEGIDKLITDISSMKNLAAKIAMTTGNATPEGKQVLSIINQGLDKLLSKINKVNLEARQNLNVSDTPQAPNRNGFNK